MENAIATKVREKPGIHFRQLKRDMGCSSTTLNYHLDGLEVNDRKIRGYRRLYPEDVSEDMERPLAALNHPVRGPMIYHIREGSSPKDLVDKLDVSKSTVSTHLKVLDEDQLIDSEKDGRRKKLSVTERSIKALNRYAYDLLDEASEGFIEMWE